MRRANRTVLITGASCGVGLAALLFLAERGTEVVMICRDPVRVRSEVAKYATESSPILFLADISSQADIRKLALELHGSFDSIDVLINNVGAIYGRQAPTTDGVEKTLALNHLAPFLLTTLLLDLLRSAAVDNVDRFLKLQCAWP